MSKERLTSKRLEGWGTAITTIVIRVGIFISINNSKSCNLYTSFVTRQWKKCLASPDLRAKIHRKNVEKDLLTDNSLIGTCSDYNSLSETFDVSETDSVTILGGM